MNWQPIKTCPRDGRAFLVLGEDDLIQICSLVKDEGKRTIKRRWFRPPIENVEREAGYFWYYAMPWQGSYMRLNMRPDGEFKPKFWMSLDALPPFPESEQEAA